MNGANALLDRNIDGGITSNCLTEGGRGKTRLPPEEGAEVGRAAETDQHRDFLNGVARREQQFLSVANSHADEFLAGSAPEMLEEMTLQSLPGDMHRIEDLLDGRAIAGAFVDQAQGQFKVAVGFQMRHGAPENKELFNAIIGKLCRRMEPVVTFISKFNFQI
jgi:hypothetical protein